MSNDDQDKYLALLERYHALLAEHNALMRKHVVCLDDQRDGLTEFVALQEAFLALQEADNKLRGDLAAMTQRATELENLIEAFGLCHPEVPQGAWWPGAAPKRANVPDTFEAWEQQQGGAE